MKFWDASAIIPLCVGESRSAGTRRLLKKDPEMMVWWGTPVECESAFARLHREGRMTSRDETLARSLLEDLSLAWNEIQPVNEIRLLARRALRLHNLRAADALQLAAALLWSKNKPHGTEVVCFDQRLAEAARSEGFSTLLP